MQLRPRPKRQVFENDAASLVGEVLAAVVYRQNMPAPDWENEPFHSVLFGVELRFASGRRIVVDWGTDYNQHDLKIHQQPPHDAAVVEFEMTGDAAWRPLVGHSISGVRVVWDREGAVEWPQTLVLFIGQGVVVASAAHFDPPSTIWRMHDDVLLCFDLAVAERFGLLTARVE